MCQQIFLYLLSLLALTHALPTSVDALLPRVNEVCGPSIRLFKAASIVSAFTTEEPPAVTYQNFVNVGFTPNHTASIAPNGLPPFPIQMPFPLFGVLNRQLTFLFTATYTDIPATNTAVIHGDVTFNDHALDLLHLHLLAPLTFHIEISVKFDENCNVSDLPGVATVPTDVLGTPIDVMAVGGLLLHPPCIPGFCEDAA